MLVDLGLALTLNLPMNMEEKAPSPQPSPAEREREKGRQREGNAAKFMGSLRENLFRGILSPPREEIEVAVRWGGPRGFAGGRSWRHGTNRTNGTHRGGSNQSGSIKVNQTKSNLCPGIVN